MPKPLEPVGWGRGWHDEECDEFFPFRWMTCEAELDLPVTSPFLAFYAFSEFVDASQVLTVQVEGRTVSELPLVHQWAPYSVEVPAGSRTVTFVLNKPFPRAYYPRDRRELGIRVAEIRPHGDPAAHAAILRAHANAVLNVRETVERKVELASYPLSLGVDLYGRCNMTPPCVYCLWDSSKAMEGERAGVVVDQAALEGYGAFYEGARVLVNCSIGEPLLNPDLAGILEGLEHRGKFLEMSTNGLALTRRAAEQLAGRKVFLYVSLDAATASTYAKIRNEKFDLIVNQLRELTRLRRERGGWPKLYMVFMPMRVNRRDLGDYFRLCRDLAADALVLRPLNILGERQPVVHRAGYAFDYEQEHLTPAEQGDLFAEAVRLSEATGVRVLNQYFFGSLPGAAAQDPKAEPDAPSDGGEKPDLGHGRLPLCREPWQNYYILRRGVMPCCYGGDKIAPMDRWEEAWNAPILREIRAHLREGRFSRYCQESLACPIVQRHALARAPDSAEVRQPAWLRAAKTVNRAALGLPGKVWKRLKGNR